MSQATAGRSTFVESDAPHLEVRKLLRNDGGVQVFDARQIDTNRRIMLRVCPLAQCALGQSAAQVERAIAKLRTLRHPGLPVIYNGGVTGQSIYLEIEFTPGRFLSEFCSERRLTDRQLLELTSKACEVLEYLHSQGIAYGELLPHGALFARSAGSLRSSLRLVRCEGMRALKPDGADQRAFGTFVTALIDSAPAQLESPVVRELQMIARQCAATANPPSFSAIARELRSLAERRDQSAASNLTHLAEPLFIQPPPPAKAKAPVASGNGSVLSRLWIFVVVIIGGIAGFVGSMNSDRPSTRTSTLQPSWNTKVAPQIDVSRPRYNFSQPHDDSFGGGGGGRPSPIAVPHVMPPSARAYQVTPPNPRTYHATPSPHRMQHPPGSAFERLGIPTPPTPSPPMTMPGPGR